MNTVRALVTAAMLVSSAAAISATPPSRYEAQIGGDYQVSVNGCRSKTETFTVGIPNASHLDLSYKGVLAGIRVVDHSSHRGKHTFSNFGFVAGGNAITFTLYAEGSGHWISAPHTPFGNIGGGWCEGAHSANEDISIFAEYVRTEHAASHCRPN